MMGCYTHDIEVFVGETGFGWTAKGERGVLLLALRVGRGKAVQCPVQELRNT